MNADQYAEVFRKHEKDIGLEAAMTNLSNALTGEMRAKLTKSNSLHSKKLIQHLFDQAELKWQAVIHRLDNPRLNGSTLSGFLRYRLDQDEKIRQAQMPHGSAEVLEGDPSA